MPTADTPTAADDAATIGPATSPTAGSTIGAMTSGPGPARDLMVAGRYRLGPVLGRGGVATVYRGHDSVLDRTVAVKVFGPAVDATDPLRIRSETRILASLHHPCLVAVHDAGTDRQPGLADRAFLVMQLVDGVSLAAVAREHQLGTAAMARIGHRVASGLAYVHARGVVHRDIKPANILLDSAGDAYLADFGIAVTTGDPALTSTGLLMGTAPYLSPEQVRGEPVTGATDVYALGLALLEALTGRREYPGTGVESALARLSRPPRVDDTLPAAWQELLTAMTDPDASRRPSAATVAAQLADHAPEPAAPGPATDAETQVLVTPTRVLPTPRTPPPGGLPDPAPGRSLPAQADQVTGHSRRRTVLVLAAVIGLLVALAVAVALTRAPTAVGPAVAPASVPSPTGSLAGDLGRLRQLVTP